MTAPTIPSTASELEELLSNKAKVDEIIAQGGLKELVTNYARVVNQKDADIQRQIREEVERVTAEFLRDNADAEITRPNFNPEALIPAKSALYNRKAPGAKIDQAKLFEDSADFFAKTWHGAHSKDAVEAQDKLRQIRNDFGSVVPSDGGFLIPETLRSELLRVSLETAIVRPRARVVPMETLTLPFPTIDASSNAANVYGGVTSYWTEEGGQLEESSAKFGRVKLEAKKHTAYTEVPNELFTDSIISLAMFINEVFPEAIAWFEDIAFMRGNGAGQPLGFLNSGNKAAVTVARAGAGKITWDDVVKMYARMLPTSLGRSVWIANIDTFPQLANLAVPVKNVAGTENVGGSGAWINNVAGGPPIAILGRPVIFTEKAESLGTAGDFNLVDLGYYLIGDRQTMQSLSSPHYKFANDVTAMRFIQRVDGRPWIQNAITPNKGANTLSPFVKLG